MSPEDEARCRTLIDVNDGSGVGEIDGVHFDLRSDLSAGGPQAGDWFSGCMIGEEDLPSTFAAFPHRRQVCWPWATPDWAGLWEERRTAAQNRGVNPDSARGRRFTLVGLARNVPEVAVVAGDTIVVDRVERAWEGDGFDEVDDAEVAYLFLAVRHADGQIERLSEPRTYRRRSAFGLRSDALRLAARVCLRWGLENLDAYVLDYDLIQGGIYWDEAALERTQSAFRELAAISARMGGVDEHWPGELNNTLGRMVDWFVSAGYALAKAEAETTVMPHARRGLKAVEGGAEGGRKRGDRRRQWVAANWEPHALSLAKAKRAAEPGISQTNLAADVQTGWKLTGESPGFDWLLTFIRRAEADDRLPKRVPGGGSKGVR